MRHYLNKWQSADIANDAHRSVNEGRFIPVTHQSARMQLKAGRGYPIKLEYISSGGDMNVLKLGVRAPAGVIEQA